MSDLIDRQALKDYVSSLSTHPLNEWDTWGVIAAIDKQPTVAASPWHRVEDDPPDEKTDAIFYYEWTGISGTVYKETSIISLEELMALGCRPIAWMEKPEPPKEEEHGN